jgi:hypothetical protein
MHEESERRLAFGAVADEYDRVRPRYPDALFDAIAEAIENAGGTVERRYFAVLFGARP